MVNAPESADDIVSHLDRALKLMAERHDDYVKAWSYYEGSASEVSMVGKAVASVINKTAEDHPISLAHIPVDTIIDRIELTGLHAADDNADKKLTQVIEDNELTAEIDDWHLKAGIYGDYYAVVDPRDEDSSSGVASELDVTGRSPLTAIVMYDRKTNRVAEYGITRWKGNGSRWHALVYYDDVTVELVTPEGQRDGQVPASNLFAVALDDSDEEVRVPHAGGHMLIVHYAVLSRPYGTPLHKRAWGPQDALTKISATNLANVEAQGFPLRYALLDPLAETDDDIDDDFGTNGPSTPAAKGDGQTAATTGSSGVRTVPGTIKLLRGIKEVGQLDATTSKDFLENGEWYVRVMAVATGVPLFEFDLNGEQPSGEARRRAEGRAIKRARKVERALGSSHRTLGEVILGCLGVASDITPTWAPTEMALDKDGLELVSAKIKAGVPPRQAFTEAGYSETLVGEWFPDDLQMTPELLTIYATALAALGNAKTLGVITDAELADMLPTILTAARLESELPPAPAPAPAA